MYGISRAPPTVAFIEAAYQLQLEQSCERGVFDVAIAAAERDGTGWAMLIGDFSQRLRLYQVGGTSGVLELDEEFRRIDHLFSNRCFGPTRLAFYKLFYFLLHQLTIWDLVTTSIPDADNVTSQMLSHQPIIPLSASCETSSSHFMTIRRMPVRASTLNYEALPHRREELANLFAPGVCFAALDEPELFFEHCEKFHAANLRGEKYCFLQILGVEDIGRWKDICDRLFASNFVALWLSDLGGPQSESVVTLMTTGIAPYEI